MARKKAAVPKQVEAITHEDTRVNLPTADAHDLVTPAVEAVETVAYPREIHTPMLVWKGKEEQDDHDLEVDAPPIYIQEKIDPRVIIERLQRRGPRPPDVVSLFETFDGLDEMRRVEFYEHDANWTNRMILGDSLQVMASLDTRERLRGKVQMIYMDPPYGIKFASNWQVSARKRDVKDGKLEDVAREAEQIKAFRDTWELGIHSYLSYLRDRLLVARDLLTESGSVFVQIGDENVHLVRSVMDEVFGAENFVSLISFATTTGFAQAEALGRNGDYLVWYARSRGSLKAHKLLTRHDDRVAYRWLLLADGTQRGMTKAERDGEETTPAGALLYAPDNLQSQGAASTAQPFEYDGQTYKPNSASHWKASFPEGMERLAWAGRIHTAKNSLRYRRFANDFPYVAQTNFWLDTSTGNFTDDKFYVVQTNTKVVERCMLMTTDPGDLVLDPTCGSGTTAAVAEQWGRRWITIDTSRVALALARQRLMGARYPYYLLRDSDEGQAKEAELVATPPPPSLTTGDIKKGFVYERVPHIMLKSIANNPDIKEGMSREEIDAAIRRHADFEELVDKPYEDKTKVRVSGPFTVESLSPHRQLAFARHDDTDPQPRAAREADADPDAPTFEQTILDNLRAAGIQNGRRDERLTFEAIEPYAGAYTSKPSA